MFGDDGQEFEGDPFGGAKQYESNNKDRVKNVNLHKSNTIKKNLFMMQEKQLKKLN